MNTRKINVKKIKIKIQGLVILSASGCEYNSKFKKLINYSNNNNNIALLYYNIWSQVVAYTVSLSWCMAIVCNQIDYVMKPWLQEEKDVKKKKLLKKKYTIIFSFLLSNINADLQRSTMFSETKRRRDFRKNNTFRFLDLQRNLLHGLFFSVGRRENKRQHAAGVKK